MPPDNRGRSTPDWGVILGLLKQLLILMPRAVRVYLAVFFVASFWGLPALCRGSMVGCSQAIVILAYIGLAALAMLLCAFKD
jgi:hypothetical protein